MQLVVKSKVELDSNADTYIVGIAVWSYKIMNDLQILSVMIPKMATGLLKWLILHLLLMTQWPTNHT